MTPTNADFQGNNTSAWRRDIVAVNGFDNDWGYGSEDRALGVRLSHYGVRGLQARHRAVAMHLEHDRPYAPPKCGSATRPGWSSSGNPRLWKRRMDCAS